jgi:DNA-directed RNA polymerase specialized sigma24 family protein
VTTGRAAGLSSVLRTARSTRRAPATDPPHLDAGSRGWVDRLGSDSPEIADRYSAPQQDLDAKELFGTLQGAMEGELSPHQRELLVAVTPNDIPIEVLAERLSTPRRALYKTIHDAWRKLRAALAASELRVGGTGAAAS